VSPLFKRKEHGQAAAAPSGGGVTPIGSVTWRQRAKVKGRVRSVRVQPLAGIPTLECTVYDETGGLAVVFLGRREIPGIGPGTTLTAEGMVSDHQGRLAILNPDYQLLS
jgi:hypothetical protein